MSIKVYKPTSAGRRFGSIVGQEDITATNPKKSLILMFKRNAGRNNQGKLTVRHRGGGAKRYYRLIDFKQAKYNIPAVVQTIERDPFRGARIALVQYKDKEYRYILAPQDLKTGDNVLSSLEAISPNAGWRMPLKYIPIGNLIYNIELAPGEGGKIVRGAGLSAKLLAIENGYAQVKLPSGEVRMAKEDCLASVGQLSNPDHRLTCWGKAGRIRHLGRRPQVRGKAMNPVDHPHGGGEGNCPIGLTHPKTPWGKPARGVKTRQPGKWSDKFILSRRGKKHH
ncbi:MAG: 50S ribosomal protein L2 [bacterium]|nr:50S ribosomal protein L2 [bacterium]